MTFEESLARALSGERTGAVPGRIALAIEVEEIASVIEFLTARGIAFTQQPNPLRKLVVAYDAKGGVVFFHAQPR